MTDAISNQHENPHPGEKLQLSPATAIHEVMRDMGAHNFSTGNEQATRTLEHSKVLPVLGLNDDIRNGGGKLEKPPASHHNFKPGEAYEGTFPVDHSDEGNGGAGSPPEGSITHPPVGKPHPPADSTHPFVPGQPYEGSLGDDHGYGHGDEEIGGGGGVGGGQDKPHPPLHRPDPHQYHPTRTE